MEIKIKGKPVLSSPQKVCDCILNLWEEFPEYDKGRENMFVLYFDTQNALLSVELHAQGTVSYSIVYPREVIRKALFVNASGIILVHNHPSGDALPSREDRRLTNKIKEASKLMDITVLDHLIIGNATDYMYSFQEHPEHGGI